MSIDVGAIKRWHRGPNRMKNCHGCRQSWPCEAIEMVTEIERLRPETERLTVELEKTRERLRAAEQKRDEHLMALSSANEEKGAFRRQRDEVQQALAALMGKIQ